MEMDKGTIIKLIEDRARGEKTRVLFDLLMTTVGATFEMKQHEVFEKIKEAVEAEQKAHMALMPDLDPLPQTTEQRVEKEIKTRKKRQGSADIHPNEDKVLPLFTDEHGDTYDPNVEF